MRGSLELADDTAATAAAAGAGAAEVELDFCGVAAGDTRTAAAAAAGTPSAYDGRRCGAAGDVPLDVVGANFGSGAACPVVLSAGERVAGEGLDDGEVVEVEAEVGSLRVWRACWRSALMRGVTRDGRRAGATAIGRSPALGCRVVADVVTAVGGGGGGVEPV